jgi:hypothetical protein
MARLTTDRNDPGLEYGVDETPREQSEAYLVLSDDERAQGMVRPLRTCYTHTVCGEDTEMSHGLAATYARDPKFYGATYCVHCRMHRPVREFVWSGTDQLVGS